MQYRRLFTPRYPGWAQWLGRVWHSRDCRVVFLLKEGGAYATPALPGGRAGGLSPGAPDGCAVIFQASTRLDGSLS